MSEIDDCRDMMSVAGGDQKAMEGIVNRHQQRLVNWFSKFNKNDAEDLTQEVFIRLYRSAAAFKPDDFLAYMFRIARNLLIDRARRYHQSQAEEFFEDSYEPPRQWEPVENAIANEIIYETAHALQNIPPEQAQTIALYVDGHSLPEIAERCDACLSTVKSRVRIGRDRLVSRMGRKAAELLS